MVYIVMVNCKNPLDAEVLKDRNGNNKTWRSSDEAQEVANKINSREGDGSARTVCL